jgi:glycine/D-amino acid oxidase-like deaminating enzyme
MSPRAAMTATSEVQNTSWWRTATASPPTETLSADLNVDVAVIGAGMTGLTAAWHLARQGARVAVFEAEAIGSGASGVNAGFVVPNFAKADPAAVLTRLGKERGRRLLALIGAGADRVFATVRDQMIDCDAEQTGWMQVAHTDAMLAILRRRAEDWQALGRPVSILSADEAQQRTSLRFCAGALLDESGGMLHPLSYVRGLARLAIGAGAAVFEKAGVQSIERKGADWRLAVGRHSIDAGKVLLCTNAADYGIARRLSRSVVPLPVYQIATGPLPRAVAERIAPSRHPIADTRANLFTYRLDRDNRLISGGVAMVPLGAHERMARMIARRLMRELGLTEMPALDHVWRGTAAMTTDFLPHLYELGPGFIGGIGCNGRGIALTAMLGEVLAQAASGARLDALPIPMAKARPIPFHLLARAAPSVAIAQARWQDHLSIRGHS